MSVGELTAIDGLDCGWVCRPFLGNIISGDAVYVHETQQHLRLAVFDGMGHGANAATFPDAAVKFLTEHWKNNPESSLLDLDQNTKSTAGGAAAVAILDKSDFSLRYAVGGNIGLFYFDIEDGLIHTIGPEGYIGSGKARISSRIFQLAGDGILGIYRDGLGDKFELKPSSKFHSALALARKLVEEDGKDYDDVTCLILKRCHYEHKS